MARQLAEAHVNLLIEKPLSTTLVGVEELAQLAEREGLVTAVGYCWRAMPAVAALRDAVTKGKFGQPLEIIAVTGQNFPHYRPAYREIYYRDRASGGGAIQDALTHVLNAGEWIAGPIERLVADAAHQALEEVDVEDTVHVLTRQGKTMGCYSLNQHQAPNEAMIQIVCERGTLRAEVHRSWLQWMTQPDTSWETNELPKMERDDLYTHQAHAYLDAVEGHSPPLCTLAEGVQSLKVNLAVIASCSSTNAWVAV
jgi:predicted dehydrogenase